MDFRRTKGQQGTGTAELGTVVMIHHDLSPGGWKLVEGPNRERGPRRRSNYSRGWEVQAFQMCELLQM